MDFRKLSIKYCSSTISKVNDTSKKEMLTSVNQEAGFTPSWACEEMGRGAATTAGWRKAPALTQRVCTRGIAGPRSISLKNTTSTARFRVVRAAET